MKKLLIFALVMTLLLGLAPASAMGAETNNGKIAMDLVIVIDQSDSMLTNDSDGYRMDAAQIMLSMIDTQYSNVGLVVFHDYVRTTEPYLNTMYPMSSSQNRNFLIQSLQTDRGEYTNKTGRVGTYTDIGVAVQRALELLIPYDGNGNEKVVLLLTDGEIFKKTPAEEETSKQQALAAIDEAVKHGIRIYSIYLAGNKQTDTSLINRMAIETGARADGCAEVTSADSLPTFFNEIFASQIGSDLVEVKADQTEMDTQRGSGYRMLQIDVPNNSVKEINIVISTADISDTSSIVLYDPEGKECRANNKTLFSYDTTHFKTYKIMQPMANKDGQKWRLSFMGNEATQVSIQYVFSYNVDVEMQLEKTTAAKSDPFVVRAMFTEDGLAISDTSMYESISAKLSINKTMPNGSVQQVAADLPMEVDKSGFTPQYKLSLDLRNTLQGQFSAGEYTAQVEFVGAGMKRTCNPASFTLTNDAPISVQAFEPMVFGFNDPNTGVSTPDQSIDLANYITDPNGDALTWSVLSCPANVLAELSGSVLTVKQTEQEAGGQIELQAADGDGGASTFPLDVRVEDKSGIYSGYAITMTVDGLSIGENGKVALAKGQQVTVRLTPTQQGNVITAPIYAPEISLNGTPINVQADTNGTYIGGFTAATVETAYTLSASGKFGSAEAGSERSAALQLEVINNAPQSTGKWEAEGPIALLQQQGGGALANLFSQPEDTPFWVDPFLLDSPTNYIMMDASTFFTDLDGDAETLAYSATLNGAPLALKDDTMLTVADSDLQGRGTYELVLLCTDSDGEQATESARFTVYSLAERERNNLLMLLIIVVAAIIIILLIRYMLLPKYPRGSKLGLFIRGITQGVEKNLPSRGTGAKKKRSLATFYDASIGRLTNETIKAETLRKITISPARNGIRVTLEKNAARQILVSVGGRELSDKTPSAVLGKGQRISIRSRGENPTEIAYELR